MIAKIRLPRAVRVDRRERFLLRSRFAGGAMAPSVDADDGTGGSRASLCERRLWEDDRSHRS